MTTSFDTQFNERQGAINGPQAVMWEGPDAVDGDAYPWLRAGLGSLYLQKGSAGQVRTWQKVDDAGRDDDWSALGGLHVISQRILVSQFTDGGSTAGTLALSQQIPVGAFVVRCYLLNLVGFTGDTSATMIVGDGSTTNRYNTGTPSVFTTANAIDLGAVSGTAIHIAATTPTITVTTNADFTSCKSNGGGAATIRILYYL